MFGLRRHNSNDMFESTLHKMMKSTSTRRKPSITGFHRGQEIQAGRKTVGNLLILTLICHLHRCGFRTIRIPIASRRLMMMMEI